jgi:hypothetical protein
MTITNNFLLVFRLTSMINENTDDGNKNGFPLPATSLCIGIREPHKRCFQFPKGDIEYWTRYGTDYLLRGEGT